MSVYTQMCWVNEEPSEEESTPPIPSFGPHPDTSKEYNFEDEVGKLPFKFNLGDAPFSKEQKDSLLNLIYDLKKVFSLHDEDLGYCNKLACSIPTMTDKPVYLPHRIIPRQLQGMVWKCLDTWLRQCIIRPSNSLYASQVVIVRKKTREIQLCYLFVYLLGSKGEIWYPDTSHILHKTTNFFGNFQYFQACRNGSAPMGDKAFNRTFLVSLVLKQTIVCLYWNV